ncbi:MAG: TolB family protein [Anaerolineales bacterium]
MHRSHGEINRIFKLEPIGKLIGPILGQLFPVSDFQIYERGIVDGRVMADAYVFTPGGTDSYPWVKVIPPGEYEAEEYREGYVSAFGEASRGRLPMVVGGFVPSFGPEGDYFYDQRLVLATLPDGRHLAFVAAIEGPAADVYVYDSEQGTLERVATGPMHASTPTWSPDGRGILYREIRYQSNVIPPPRRNLTSLLWVPFGEGSSYYFVDPTFPRAWHFLYQWLDNQRFTFWTMAPGGAGVDENLSMGDLESGRSVRIVEDIENAATIHVGVEVTILASAYSQGKGREFFLIDGASGEARQLAISIRRSPSMRVWIDWAIS